MGVVAGFCPAVLMRQRPHGRTVNANEGIILCPIRQEVRTIYKTRNQLHVAFDDFRIVYDNLNGGNRTTKHRLVPFCLFTDPELARVGRNESEARRDGIAYRVATMRTADVLRTRTVSEPRGFLKMLVGAHSDDILGFTAFGFEAGEPMAVVQTAMLGRMPYTILRDALFTHPTMSEGLIGLLASIPAQSTQRSA